MIAIKGTNMPKDCYECPMVCLSDPDELFCVALKSRPICEYDDYEKRPEWCPLVDIPDDAINIARLQRKLDEIIAKEVLKSVKRLAVTKPIVFEEDNK